MRVKPGNDLQRWGNQQGLVYVNGQKVNLSKPRVVRKSANKHEEVELETYKAFSKPTAMNEAVHGPKCSQACQRETTLAPSKQCLTVTA